MLLCQLVIIMMCKRSEQFLEQQQQQHTAYFSVHFCMDIKMLRHTWNSCVAASSRHLLLDLRNDLFLHPEPRILKIHPLLIGVKAEVSRIVSRTL